MDDSDTTIPADVENVALRARLRLATREAISAAALRLALEYGPENVRVHDIAAAAGVSPRTYNNYFASREQAICAALAAERALRVGATPALHGEYLRTQTAIEQVLAAAIAARIGAGEHDLTPQVLAAAAAGAARVAAEHWSRSEGDEPFSAVLRDALAALAPAARAVGIA